MKANRLIMPIVVALITFASWISVFDTRSTEYIDGAIVQSTGAFAVARGLNAIISTAQSTQLSFSIGAGLSMTVGEVLDPLNDLVEQYSSLMKISIVSLIIQKLLIEITTDTFFKIGITASAFSAIAGFFVFKAPLQNFLLRLFFSFVFIRFILVFTVLANGIFEQSFLAQSIEKESRALEVLRDENRIERDSSALSSEQTTALINQKDENVQAIANLEIAQSSLLEIKDRLTEELVEIEANLAIARQDAGLLRSVVNRVVPQDETLNGHTNRKKEHEIHLKATEKQLATIEKYRKEFAEDNQNIALKLQGLPTDFLGKTGRWIAEKKSMITSTFDELSIDELVKNLDNAVESILRLMALFIFKTLILPLMFMATLIWGAKQIWRVNLHSLFFDDTKNDQSNQKLIN